MSTSDGGDEHATDRDVDLEVYDGAIVSRMTLQCMTGGDELGLKILPRW